MASVFLQNSFSSDFLFKVCSYFSAIKPKMTHLHMEQESEGVSAVTYKTTKAFFPSSDLKNFAICCNLFQRVARENFRTRLPDGSIDNFGNPLPRASKEQRLLAGLVTTEKNWDKARKIVKSIQVDCQHWQPKDPLISGTHLQLNMRFERSEEDRAGGTLNRSHVQLACRLLENNCLDVLNIINQNMSTSIEYIADALRGNKTISGLVFVHSHITSKDAMDLAAILAQQGDDALETIDLSNPNALKPWFFTRAAQEQEVYRNGQFNKIDDAAAEALVNAVITKPRFQMLDLQGNLISQECKEILVQRMNAAEKRLYI